MSIISSQQRADFERDGFLILPGFASAKEVEKLRDAATDIMTAAATAGGSDDTADRNTVFNTVDQAHAQDEWFLTSGDKIRCFLEEQTHPDGTPAVNKIGHALHDLDPAFIEFSYRSDLVELVSDLGFVAPQMLQSMYICKSPKVGGEVVPHTDHSFLWTEPQTVTGLWLAIDHATVENGCMWAVPGAHRQPVRNRFQRDGNGTVMVDLDPTPWPTDGWVPLEAAPGTLIALHGQLPHKSEHNHSDHVRHAYTVHVIDATADYPADNWLQRGPELPLQPMVAARR